MRLLARRALAYALDCALLAALVVATQLGLRAGLGPRMPALATGPQLEAWVLGTVSVPVWAYFSLFESSRWQATPAKRLLGLHTTTTDGRRLSWPRALARTALKLLPWELTHMALLLPVPLWSAPAPAGLPPGLWLAYGLLGVYAAVAALTPRHRAPHDWVVGSVVTPAESGQ